MMYQTRVERGRVLQRASLVDGRRVRDDAPVAVAVADDRPSPHGDAVLQSHERLSAKCGAVRVPERTTTVVLESLFSLKNLKRIIIMDRGYRKAVGERA